MVYLFIVCMIRSPSYVTSPLQSRNCPIPHYRIQSQTEISWTSLKFGYSIQLKWLNLITAPSSVSNKPGSVTWLATKYLKTVSWRNHTKNLQYCDHRIYHFGLKSTFHLHISLFQCSFAWKMLSNSSLTCDSCRILDLINFQNNLT